MKNLLKDVVDNHIHCCPHINKRSTNISEVVMHAEDSGMYAIGLMDNFCNTSGYASLIKKYNPNLKLKVFGGLIMEPPAGGINLSNVSRAIKTTKTKGLDISSGVEISKGIKSPRLIKSFVRKCRNI